MNRGERREAAKGVPKEELRVANILIILANGSIVTLDISKVNIVDKETNRPLFNTPEVKPDVS